MAWNLIYRERICGIPISSHCLLLDVSHNDSCQEVIKKAKSDWQRITSCVPKDKFFAPEVVFPILDVEDKSGTGVPEGKLNPVHDPDPTAEQ